MSRIVYDIYKIFPAEVKHDSSREHLNISFGYLIWKEMQNMQLFLETFWKIELTKPSNREFVELLNRGVFAF